MKKVISVCLFIGITLVSTWYLFTLIKNKRVDKYKGDCINYQEKQFFKKPVPIYLDSKI